MKRSTDVRGIATISLINLASNIAARTKYIIRSELRKQLRRKSSAKLHSYATMTRARADERSRMRRGLPRL